LNIDWESTLGRFHGDVESMWNKFKQMLGQAVEKNVPKLNCFSSWKKSKWKRPVGREIRNSIQEKHRTWKCYIATKDINVYRKYQKQTNLVRKYTRNICKSEQLEIAKEAKVNPIFCLEIYKQKIKKGK
jgi:hypothetical protein